MLPLQHVVIDVEVVCLALCLPRLRSIYEPSTGALEYGSWVITPRA